MNFVKLTSQPHLSTNQTVYMDPVRRMVTEMTNAQILVAVNYPIRCCQGPGGMFKTFKRVQNSRQFYVHFINYPFHF